MSGTVRCEVCGNDVAPEEAVEQPYAEEDAAVLGPSWWACRACVDSTAARPPDPALVAEAVEALRAVGMTEAADAITTHPSSDRLASAAQRLAFWIATERGNEKTRRALRAVAALAEQAGSGKRMRTTIGKEWARAHAWLARPRPERERLFNGRRLAVRVATDMPIFAVQIRRKPFDVGPPILSWGIGDPLTRIAHGSAARASLLWGEFVDQRIPDLYEVKGESYVVLCDRDDHERSVYRPCTSLVLVEEGDGCYAVYKRGQAPKAASTPEPPEPAATPPHVVTTPEEADVLYGKAFGAGDMMRKAAAQARATSQIVVVPAPHRDEPPESQRVGSPPVETDDSAHPDDAVPVDTSPLHLPDLAPSVPQPKPAPDLLADFIRNTRRNTRLEHVTVNDRGEIVEFELRSYVRAKYGLFGIEGHEEDPTEWLRDIRSIGMLQHALDVGGTPMARALLGLPSPMTNERAIELIQENPPQPRRAP